jgi:hypothetical protein
VPKKSSLLFFSTGTGGAASFSAHAKLHTKNMGKNDERKTTKK